MRNRFNGLLFLIIKPAEEEEILFRCCIAVRRRGGIRVLPIQPHPIGKRSIMQNTRQLRTGISNSEKYIFDSRNTISA